MNGGWVLVQIRNDRTDGKTENWLLIKRRDAFPEDDDADFPETSAASIASGRTMKQIAVDQGRAPTLLMTPKGQPSNAIS